MTIPEKENQRTCLYCDRRIQGRTEKKFCGVDCKNNYNSRKKAELKAKGAPNQKEIINIIKNNYQILLEYKAGENELRVTEVTEKELHKKGFDPHYFTNLVDQPMYGPWKCCFDICYLSDRSGNYKLRSLPPTPYYIDEDTGEALKGYPRFD